MKTSLTCNPSETGENYFKSIYFKPLEIFLKVNNKWRNNYSKKNLQKFSKKGDSLWYLTATFLSPPSSVW